MGKILEMVFCFQNCSKRFSDLEYTFEKIIVIYKHAGKVRQFFWRMVKAR
jgi:hypothetical protein